MGPRPTSRYEGRMTPSFYPELVNDRFGDPALYVDLKFEKRALLFDLGDLHALTPRKILRLSDIFVTHAHVDHFIGFDQVLRVLLGRDKRVRLFGPRGFIDQVEHKLAAYSWNLTDRYESDLTFAATELLDDGVARVAEFRIKERFRRAEKSRARRASDIILDDEMFRVRATVLDHDIPCLAFAIEEHGHVNVRKAALEALGLRVGPWLRELKHAVMLGRPDTTPFRIPPAKGEGPDYRVFPLGDLKEKLMTVTRGQKIAYVVDVLFNQQNADRIVGLARDADSLFIEATFSRDDSQRAAERFHLTTAQAGELARRAQVRQVVPFHFSPRYAGQEERLLSEVEEAFGGAFQQNGAVMAGGQEI
jgi:ribonuclease Z